MDPRKFPEASSEASSEAQPEEPGTVWVKIPEAAKLLGMSERAARDWVKRQHIPQRGERPTLVSEAAIRKRMAELGKTPERIPELPGGSSEPIDVPYRLNDGADRILVPLDRMLEQAQSIGEQLTALARRNEELALEVGTLRERTTHQEQEISRLATERNAMQSRIDELTAPAPPEVPAPLDQSPPRPWWKFWLAD